MLSILFIDEVGIPFNGATLYSRGLGGSESAIILLSKELVKIGFNVTVLNHSITETSISGIFDNVTYYDFTELSKLSSHYDIVISSRSVKPFLPHPNNPYTFITNNTYKIVWLHDTFCAGDEYLESLITANYINEIFTLSDFHTNYILNANHGRKRQYEVLKNKVFQTRNGALKYSVSYTNKNKNNFVYNSSITKGLIPLLNDIWPTIKHNIPDANLTIIGGYYDLPNDDYNESKEKLLSLTQDEYYKSLGVNFTGIIKQSQIAKILANSGFMIYPAAFPETFGISSLESLLYNTPIITCRFGALEETALEKSCYLIDYSIEPNSVYPDVIKKDQVSKFIDLVLYAYHNDYLYSQKQQYCSIIDSVYKWETIALQWKQHLYYKLGYFLPKEEYQTVTKINDDVKRIFNRKFTNLVEVDKYPVYNNIEKHISIITPVFNAENYIERCIQSVITQNYSNYTHYIIDDNSTDNTKNIIKQYLSDQVILIENTENKGAVYNQYNTIINYCNENDIIILLDGDDCLVNNNTIFNYYNELHNHYDFTYGSCWSEADNIPLIAQEYPDNIKEEKSYRSHLFAWNIPYTHLRTFKKFLINDINENKLKQDNEWVKAGGDGALFYELIEQSDINRIKAVKDIMVMYNDKNPINDYKVNSTQQTITANKIIRKDIDNKEKFSVIIPTMWKYEPFCNFLKELVTVDLIDEIIIINNDSKNTPINDILNDEKIKLYNFPENIYVNPAWNYGVSVSNNNKLAIINDDIEFDIKLFEKVYDYVIPENGVTGIVYNQYTNFDIDIIPHTNNNDGFGTCMFLHKDNWRPIPENLKVYYGDNFIFDNNYFCGRTNYIITNIKHSSKMAATTSLVASGEIASEGLDKEGEYYEFHKQNLINPITTISDNKIEIFYHVFVPDHVNINSLWWIDEQLSAIELSNLKDNANINMCITINKNLIYGYNKTSLESIITYINTKYNFVNILDIRDTSEENIYEQQTLNYVYEFSKHNPNTKVLYIHTKGISIFSETQKEWLEILTKTLVYDWKTCIEYLNNNDIVAINDNSNTHRKNNSLQTIVSGNFFWANTNYIATLPNPKNNSNSRYDYELWITSNNPKIAFVYNQHTNHYLEMFQDKKILIAIPTDKYIKPETFKSIYDLEVPNGYKLEFQFFYGYRIDQVRNLIAEWSKSYDYLFAVDSDIILPSDTIRKLLYADKDIVSGLYIQRIENTHNLELFSDGRISYEDIKGKGLIEVKGCGFGCVLVKSEIFRNMEYPHFLYTHALNHENTYSEDTYFCDKARLLGYKVYADTSILCGHIGETVFTVE